MTWPKEPFFVMPWQPEIWTAIVKNGRDFFKDFHMAVEVQDEFIELARQALEAYGRIRKKERWWKRWLR